MMKIIYKPIVSCLSVVAVLSPLVASASWQEDRQARIDALQAQRGEKVQETKDSRQQAFCSRFTENAANIVSNMGERRKNFQDNQGNRVGKLGENRDTRDADLDSNRADAEERRSEMYAKLEAKADTDAKKAAVAEFQETVEKAVSVRQAAVDAAIKAFRTGVDGALSGRKDDMQKAVDSFSSAVNTALDKAKADCESGTSKETVRSTFRASLVAARQSLKDDQSASDKVGTQVKALAETRRTAVKKAVDDFKATMEAARSKLKTVFGE